MTKPRFSFKNVTMLHLSFSVDWKWRWWHRCITGYWLVKEKLNKIPQNRISGRLTYIFGLWLHHPTGVPNLNGLWWGVLFKWNNSSTSDLWRTHITVADAFVVFINWLTEGATRWHLCWCRLTQQIYSVWDPPTKHSISVSEELYQQTHTHTQKMYNCAYFNQVTFVSN